jgi:hypothetical protein
MPRKSESYWWKDKSGVWHYHRPKAPVPEVSAIVATSDSPPENAPQAQLDKYRRYSRGKTIRGDQRTKSDDNLGKLDRAARKAKGSTLYRVQRRKGDSESEPGNPTEEARGALKAKAEKDPKGFQADLKAAKSSLYEARESARPYSQLTREKNPARDEAFGNVKTAQERLDALRAKKANPQKRPKGVPPKGSRERENPHGWKYAREQAKAQSESQGDTSTESATVKPVQARVRGKARRDDKLYAAAKKRRGRK